jgi:hypothetical protein
VLKVPVGLGDIVHARAAHQDSRRANENVKPAKPADDDFDEFSVTSDRAKISGYGQMRPALHLGDDRLHFVLIQIDDRDERSRGDKGQRDFAPDSSGPTRDQNALAIKA